MCCQVTTANVHSFKKFNILISSFWHVYKFHIHIFFSFWASFELHFPWSFHVGYFTKYVESVPASPHRCFLSLSCDFHFQHFSFELWVSSMLVAFEAHAYVMFCGLLTGGQSHSWCVGCHIEPAPIWKDAGVHSKSFCTTSSHTAVFCQICGFEMFECTSIYCH